MGVGTAFSTTLACVSVIAGLYTIYSSAQQANNGSEMAKGLREQVKCLNEAKTVVAEVWPKYMLPKTEHAIASHPDLATRDGLLKVPSAWRSVAFSSPDTGYTVLTEDGKCSYANAPSGLVQK